jgi:hypothetical protein
MKYNLSVEFYKQAEPTGLNEGDIISFISFKGLFKTGVIESCKYMKDTKIPIPLEYKVKCDDGVTRVALTDYIFKKNAKVSNIKITVSELDDGFPLRT